MRNLKRALSLALASIMVLGMMVVGAGAVSLSDFSDGEKIANKEAVTVLTTLGVINGKDDGTYDPEGIVTRAEMAKMICIILNGGRDPQLGETLKNSYTDTVGHWAAGYIEYCTTMGIVAGRGNGTFDPSGTVSVAEAGKMVLVALGYNSEVEGYTGANWQINVDARANPMGLYDGLGTLNTNVDLTRDNAAQMLYNALDKHMVTYNYAITGTNENAVSIKPQLNDKDKGTLLWEKFKAVKVVGVVVGNEFADLSSTKKDTDLAPNGVVIGSSLDEGKTELVVTNYDDDDQTIYGNKNYTFSVSTGEDVLGKTVSMFVKPASSSSNSLKAEVIGSAILSDDNTIVTDASGDSVKDVADDNNLDITSDTKYVYNYASESNKTFSDKDGMTGIQKTLVDTDSDGDVDYVLLKEMGLGKVTLYTEAKDGQIVVNMAGTGTVKGSFVNKDKDDVIGFEDVAKDDYVLAAYFGGRLYVEKPETVTGKIEAYKQTENKTNGVKNGTYRNTGFTVDGETYTVSRVGTYTGDLTAAVTEVDKTILSSEATFYMDQNGYVIAYGEVDESAYKYAYVWGAEAGSTISTDRVKVTLEDGTDKTYDLNSNSDIDVVKNGGNGRTTVNETDMQGRVYAYTVTSSGDIKLYLPKGGAVEADKPIFTKGLTNIQFDGRATATSIPGLKPTDIVASDIQSTTYYSGNATTFFYVTEKVDGSVKDVVVYNGRNNAPSVDGKDGEAVLALRNKNGDVGAAVFTGVTVAESAGDHMFVFNANYVWEDYGYVDAYFNGKTEVAKDTKVAIVDKDGEIIHNPTVDDGIYLYKTTSKGYYELTKLSTQSYYKAGFVSRVNKANNTFVIADENGSFLMEVKLTNNSVVVDYDSSNSSPIAYNNGSVSVGDEVQVIVNNAKDCEVLMAGIMDRADGTTGDPTHSEYAPKVAINGALLNVRHYVGDSMPSNAQIAALVKDQIEDVDKVSTRGSSIIITYTDGFSDSLTITPVPLARVTYNGKDSFLAQGETLAIAKQDTSKLLSAVTTSGTTAYTEVVAYTSGTTTGVDNSTPAKPVFAIGPAVTSTSQNVILVDGYNVDDQTSNATIGYKNVTPSANNYVAAGTVITVKAGAGETVTIADAAGKELDSVSNSTTAENYTMPAKAIVLTEDTTAVGVTITNIAGGTYTAPNGDVFNVVPAKTKGVTGEKVMVNVTPAAPVQATTITLTLTGATVVGSDSVTFTQSETAQKGIQIQLGTSNVTLGMTDNLAATQTLTLPAGVSASWSAGSAGGKVWNAGSIDAGENGAVPEGATVTLSGATNYYTIDSGANYTKAATFVMPTTATSVDDGYYKVTAGTVTIEGTNSSTATASAAIKADTSDYCKADGSITFTLTTADNALVGGANGQSVTASVSGGNANIASQTPGTTDQAFVANAAAGSTVDVTVTFSAITADPTIAFTTADKS